jgi:hypothetical protein
MGHLCPSPAKLEHLRSVAFVQVPLLGAGDVTFEYLKD